MLDSQYNHHVMSVVCSPDGQHTISGSNDKTIRFWDAETGTAGGQPLVGHNVPVNSAACSPDERHIISGSRDITVRMWDLETGTAVKRPFEGYTESKQAVAYSPDAQHTASGSSDTTFQVSNVSTQLSIHSFQTYPRLCSRPNSEGWVRDSQSALLYWVPPDCRFGLHSPVLFTIPPISHFRSVSLDLKDFAFGTSWTQIFNTA